MAKDVSRTGDEQEVGEFTRLWLVIWIQLESSSLTARGRIRRRCAGWPVLSGKKRPVGRTGDELEVGKFTRL